jgi:hypothetical protein
MPRPRPIRQPMGNPNLPDTGEVMIDLNAAGPAPPERLVYGSSVAATTVSSATGAPTSYQHGAINPDSARQPSISVRSDAPVIQPGPDDDYDADADLRRTQNRARERDKERAKQFEQQNRTALQWGQEQANRAAITSHALQEQQLDTIETALGAAEAKAQQATDAWAAAMANNDFAIAGKMQRIMMEAQRDIDKLKDGRDELQAQVRQKPQPAAPPPQAFGSNVEVIISRMPNLIESEREWIREHPDAVEKPENQQRMTVAFRDSQAKGLTRGSKEYFEFFNERLGYEDGGEIGEVEEEPPMPAPRRQETRRVSAPVSRSGNGGGQLKPGQFVLTQAQREAAKMSGVDEVTYARGVQRMMEMKGQGMYGASEQK